MWFTHNHYKRTPNKLTKIMQYKKKIQDNIFARTIISILVINNYYSFNYSNQQINRIYATYNRNQLQMFTNCDNS